jgi:PhzF family phenazine biosynthesis protein
VRVRIFQADAFARRRFTGNPAAVMLLPEGFLEDRALQAVAAENNLSETAFLVPDGDGYRLRWFTPTHEVPLCGHATLASGAVVLQRLDPDREQVVFHTVSGPLAVRRGEQGFVMNFPARVASPVDSPPEDLLAGIPATPLEVRSDGFNYLVILDGEQELRALEPDIAALGRLDLEGVIVTAPGSDGYDFVSRYFAPGHGIPEDPVTGSAHCTLATYWAQRLGRTEFRAYQASARGGELTCRLLGERVELEGTCVFYLEGMAEVG